MNKDSCYWFVPNDFIEKINDIFKCKFIPYHLLYFKNNYPEGIFIAKNGNSFSYSPIHDEEWLKKKFKFKGNISIKNERRKKLERLSTLWKTEVISG